MKLPAYSRYKPSGVEWLGDVPEHWSVKAIKWETPVLRGASPRPIDDPAYFDDEDGEYSWVRISDVTSAGTYLSTTEQKLSRLGSSLSVKLKPGALFLSIAGSVGKPCITQIKCCIHDGFVYFPRFKGDAKFLYYLFASGEPYRGLGKLGTQLNLNTDTVGSIVAGFPDLAEQRAIAAYLDRETGRVDRLVAKKRELIERLKEKRTALISRTVTRGLPAEAAAKAGLPTNPPLKPSALDWLGDIPAHWARTSLKRIVSVRGRIGFRGYTTDDLVDEGEGALALGGSNLTKTGRLDLTKRTYLSWFKYEESPEIKVEPNDLVIGQRGTCGDPVLIDRDIGPATINPSLVLLKRPTIHSGFLCYWLMGRFVQSIFGTYLSATAVPMLSQEQIGDAPVCHPPLPEQVAIAAYLDEETAKLDALVGKVEEAVERLQEYRTALITAAVTGKIDVRGTELPQAA